MSRFESSWNPRAEAAQARRQAMLARIAAWRALEERSARASAAARPVFERRGQLLPRERVALLLDRGAPWLPLSTLAGYLQDTPDAARSVPGGGVIAGIGFVEGVRCMVVASDSGIEAGAIQAMGLDKILRAQELALHNRLPFIHLVESAGANLMRYRVEGFVHGGALFRNLARHSAAGLPVITVQHGSGTAGGAYMPGLSDIVIMVRGRSRAFLAGPPLLKAATGEVATEEELGGAEMHTTISGLGDYMAEDDRDAIRIARSVMGQIDWPHERAPQKPFELPRYDAEELLGIMPMDHKRPAAFMFTYGNLAMRIARSQFSRNFFACAGFDTLDNLGFKTIEEGVQAFLDSKAEILVICSADEEYPVIAPAIYEAVKDKAIVVVAGYPKDALEELKAKGIEHFIHVRSSVLEELRKFQGMVVR